MRMPLACAELAPTSRTVTTASERRMGSPLSRKVRTVSSQRIDERWGASDCEAGGPLRNVTKDRHLDIRPLTNGANEPYSSRTGRAAPTDLPKENDEMKQVLPTLLVLGLHGSTSEAGDVKFNLSGDNTKVTFVGTKPQGKHV